MMHHKNMIISTITLFLTINVIEMISCYSIPAISIRVRRPMGFEAAIPNVRGIEKFTFIGTINRQLTNENYGDYMGDVIVPTNGEWVFQDSSVVLKVGDVLYYQVNVQYNKERFTKLDQRMVITEYNFMLGGNAGEQQQSQKPSSSALRPQQQQQQQQEQRPSRPAQSSQKQPQQQSAPSNQIGCDCPCDRKFETIETQLNVILLQLKSLHDKSSPLQDQVDSMVEVLNQLLQDSKIGTKLLLVGSAPPGNVLESVRDLVTDKLKLHDMYSNIVSAKKTENGIVFEVKSPTDKKRILFRANQYLQNSKLKIYDNNVMVPNNSENPDIETDTKDPDNMDENIDARFGGAIW